MSSLKQAVVGVVFVVRGRTMDVLCDAPYVRPLKGRTRARSARVSRTSGAAMYYASVTATFVAIVRAHAVQTHERRHEKASRQPGWGRSGVKASEGQPRGFVSAATMGTRRTRSTRAMDHERAAAGDAAYSRLARRAQTHVRRSDHTPRLCDDTHLSTRGVAMRRYAALPVTDL